MGHQLFWTYFGLMLDVHSMNPAPRELKKPVSRLLRSRQTTVLETFLLSSLRTRMFAEVGKCARIWKIWSIIYLFLSEIASWPGQYWWVLDYTRFLPPKLSITLFWIISVCNFLIRYLGNRNSWHLFYPTGLHLPTAKGSPRLNQTQRNYIYSWTPGDVHQKHIQRGPNIQL